MNTALTIDANFPGGDILVDRIDGNQVYLQQDLRDTAIDWWFYWCFRVRGAAGRTLSFNFTNRNVFTVGGAARSLDAGCTWSWLAPDCVHGDSLTYPFGDGEDDVRFSLAMPYQRERLDRFLEVHKDNPRLRVEAHASTREGRDNVRLHLGGHAGDPRHRVLVTCRHHCCEMMADYTLEGIAEAVLTQTPIGNWLAENVELLAIPMVDLDGVEAGDQGKCRNPRDHNRDYDQNSIYPTVQETRRYIPEWSQGRLRIALDLHCSWIRGGRNEMIYQVGQESPAHWREQRRFGEFLESCRQGPLPYFARDSLPFGEEWNTRRSYTDGKSSMKWAGELPGIKVVSTFEIPYAKAHDIEVNQASAKALGHDLAAALRSYLLYLEQL